MSHLKLHTGAKSNPHPLLVPTAGLIVSWAETPEYSGHPHDPLFFCHDGYRYLQHKDHKDGVSTVTVRRARIKDGPYTDADYDRIDLATWGEAEQEARHASIKKARTAWADAAYRQATVSWVGHAKEIPVHESVEEIHDLLDMADGRGLRLS